MAVAALILLVHGALHVVDHGEAADSLQEVVVRSVGTAGLTGVTCSMLYPPHTLGAPKTWDQGELKTKKFCHLFNPGETEALDL